MNIKASLSILLLSILTMSAAVVPWSSSGYELSNWGQSGEINVALAGNHWRAVIGTIAYDNSFGYAFDHMESYVNQDGYSLIPELSQVSLIIGLSILSFILWNRTINKQRGHRNNSRWPLHLT